MIYLKYWLVVSFWLTLALAIIGGIIYGMFLIGPWSLVGALFFAVTGGIAWGIYDDDKTAGRGFFEAKKPVVKKGIVE